MKKVLLIGCGNIGSRHLQALCKLLDKIEIEVIEKSEQSVKLAKNRLSEIGFSNKIDEIIWKKTIDECCKESDLVIVSTQSIGRVDIIKNLLEKRHTKFLIEKMVCQSKSEYEIILENMKIFNAKGWVNTRCRYFEFYQKIKAKIKHTPIHISMTSSFTGLGTGAIHYIDLFNWITEKNDVKLNGDMLLPNILQNKRSEKLVEFSGLINGHSEFGTISISHFPEEKIPQIVSISEPEGCITVDETNEKILNASEKFADIQFQAEYVSNTTSKIVKDIIETNQCLLPTIQDSHHSHIELFQIFNKHLEKFTNQEVKLCPIT